METWNENTGSIDSRLVTCSAWTP